MKRLGTRVLLGVALGVVCYVALTAYADFRRLGARLSEFSVAMLAPALALASLNYLLRFFKWHYYLHRLDVHVPVKESLLVFLAGFVLTVTPGKLGEVVKSYLLREIRGVPMARTAPIVVAERVTDLISLVLLALGGAFTYRAGVMGLGVAVLIVAGFVALVSWRSAALFFVRALGRLPIIRRAAHALEQAYESMAVLLRPAPLAWATLISVVAWFCECVAFFIVVRGFPGASITLHGATFTYSSMTIAGALSFLPGGLGVTEAGMTGLLTQLGRNVDAATAVGATFVTRLCTLWFAVLVGVLALLALRTRFGPGLDPEACSEARGAGMKP